MERAIDYERRANHADDWAPTFLITFAQCPSFNISSFSRPYFRQVDLTGHRTHTTHTHKFHLNKIFKDEKKIISKVNKILHM